jgi:hypothetical protein
MHYTTFENMAAGIASKAKRRDAVIITPLLQAPADPSLFTIGALPGDSAWASHVLLSDRKGRFKMERVCFGLVKAAPSLALRRASEATREQAAAVRAGLIKALRGQFREVHCPDDPVENARICARTWPGKQSEEMLAHVIANHAAGQVAGHA